MTSNAQYDRETCYFCHEPDTHLLEAHHIVPQRFGGSDDAENLVRVCPNCHERLERLYDGRFYDALGIETEPSDETDDANSGPPQRQYPLRQATDGERRLADLINSIEIQYDEGAPISKICDEAVEYGVERGAIKAEIEKLRRQGDVYEPTTDHLRTV